MSVSNSSAEKEEISSDEIIVPDEPDFKKSIFSLLKCSTKPLESQLEVKMGKINLNQD